MEVDVMIDLEDVIDRECDTLVRDYGISEAVAKNVAVLASAVMESMDGSTWVTEHGQCLYLATVLEQEAKRFRKHAEELAG